MASGNNLSTKDKMLIYFCIILAIAAGTYIFVLSPMIDEIDKLDKTLTSKSSSADQAESDEGMIDMLKADSEYYAELYDKARIGFHEPINSETADDFLTRKIQSYSLTPLAMTLERSNPSENGDNGFIPYNFVLEYGDEPPELIQIDAVDEIKVNMNVNGKLSDVKKLVDDLYDTEGVYVSLFTVQVPADQALDDAVDDIIGELWGINFDDPDIEANIGVVFYIYDSTDFDEAVRLNVEGIQTGYSEEDMEEIVDGELVEQESDEEAEEVISEATTVSETTTEEETEETEEETEETEVEETTVPETTTAAQTTVVPEAPAVETTARTTTVSETTKKETTASSESTTKKEAETKKTTVKETTAKETSKTKK